MSIEQSDSSKKIADKEALGAENDTPEVGLGLILLGALCLILGIGIGLIFSIK